MVTDPIADMLTRVRNAQRAGLPVVMVQRSKVAKAILNVLKDEGFSAQVEEVGSDSIGERGFKVYLRYDDAGMPLIRKAQRVSKCGRRIYARSTELPTVECGLGMAVISTSQGVMTDREARKRGIGGEVMALFS